MGLHLIAASSKNSLAKINFKHVSSCLQFIRKECIREPTALFPAPTNILTASPHSHQPVQGPSPAAGGIRALPAAGAFFVEGSLFSLERLSLHSLGPPLQKLLTHREQVPSPACRHAPSPGLSCPGVGIRDPACSFPSLCCEHAGTEGGWGGGGQSMLSPAHSPPRASWFTPRASSPCGHPRSRFGDTLGPGVSGITVCVCVHLQGVPSKVLPENALVCAPMCVSVCLFFTSTGS